MDVRLELVLSTASAGSGDILTATATVRNLGKSAIYHCEGCGCGVGIDFRVLGPGGGPVEIVDHCTRPLCPDDSAVLAPKTSKYAAFKFNGTLYDPACQSYAAPRGKYTIIARFWYGQSDVPSDLGTVVEKQAAFRWD